MTEFSENAGLAPLAIMAIAAAKRRRLKSVSGNTQKEDISMGYQLTEKTLYQKCREVQPGEDVADLAAAMIKIMQEKKGVGLAANQIGDDRRVIVIGTPDFRAVIVNPFIKKRSCGEMKMVEGCLSFPGEFREVIRDKQVTVAGLTVDGQPFQTKLRGLEACVAQHEIDHLDGITIIDKGTPAQ